MREHSDWGTTRKDEQKKIADFLREINFLMSDLEKCQATLKNSTAPTIRRECEEEIKGIRESLSFYYKQLDALGATYTQYDPKLSGSPDRFAAFLPLSEEQPAGERHEGDIAALARHFAELIGQASTIGTKAAEEQGIMEEINRIEKVLKKLKQG